MSCCGGITKMKIEALRSYGTVVIEVIRPGFGYQKGVYYIGDDVSEDFALRLLNNRNAKIKEYVSSEQREEIDNSTGETQPEANSDLETWGDHGDDSEADEELWG